MEQNIKWKDVTKTFEEERRYYRNTYLEDTNKILVSTKLNFNYY